MAACAATRLPEIRAAETVDSIFFGSTTSPYEEKQAASLMACHNRPWIETRTADFAGSLRAGTSPLPRRWTPSKSGAAANVWSRASDARMGAGKSQIRAERTATPRRRSASAART